MMLTVVVPTYRKRARLGLMLRSLFRAIADAGDDRDVEVIVVDDGGDAARAVVAASGAAKTARVIETARRGRSAARNRGAAEARGRRLVFLDDDVLLEPAALGSHGDAARAQDPAVVRGTIRHLPWLAPFEDPVAGTLTHAARASLAGAVDMPGVAFRRLQLDDTGRPTAASLRRSRLSGFERDLHRWLAAIGPRGAGRWIGVTGAHVSFERRAFDEVGGFDERFGLRWGGEDLELGYRAERWGLPIRHAPEAVVHHMDHDRAGRDGDHRAALEYFAAKHGAPRVLALLEYFDGRRPLEEVVAR